MARVAGTRSVWEGFFPPAKRRWGWYVVPIVFRDRLVGRIEPRIDAVASAVQVLGVWWEDGFEPRRADGFVDAMREALWEYRRFAKAVAWRHGASLLAQDVDLERVGQIVGIELDQASATT
jgi:uncharacterized protein YcaQ